MFELMKEVIAGARKIKEADRVDLIDDDAQEELESYLKADLGGPEVRRSGGIEVWP